MILGKGIAVERAMAMMVAVAMCGLFQEVEIMKVKMWIYVLLRLHLVSREAVTEVM